MPSMGTQRMVLNNIPLVKDAEIVIISDISPIVAEWDRSRNKWNLADSARHFRWRFFCQCNPKMLQDQGNKNKKTEDFIETIKSCFLATTLV